MRDYFAEKRAAELAAMAEFEQRNGVQRLPGVDQLIKAGIPLRPHYDRRKGKWTREPIAGRRNFAWG